MTTNPVFKLPHELSALLPSEARLLLARAALEARSIRDDLMRDVHMETAIQRVKLGYPHYFKE
ncbi:MAG: hypothetical protein VB138_05830 [Burkholderia sp.]